MFIWQIKSPDGTFLFDPTSVLGRGSASFLSKTCAMLKLSAGSLGIITAPHNVIMINNLQIQHSDGASLAFLDIDERRLAKHVPVASALRAAPAQIVNEIIHLANLQTDSWEKNSLCSSDYISAWRELLKRPNDAASILEERSSHAAALRQNSPFVASVRKFQVRAA